jgi:hypothetical protein
MMRAARIFADAALYDLEAYNLMLSAKVEPLDTESVG